MGDSVIGNFEDPVHVIKANDGKICVPIPLPTPSTCLHGEPSKNLYIPGNERGESQISWWVDVF